MSIASSDEKEKEKKQVSERRLMCDDKIPRIRGTLYWLLPILPPRIVVGRDVS